MLTVVFVVFELGEQGSSFGFPCMLRGLVLIWCLLSYTVSAVGRMGVQQPPLSEGASLLPARKMKLRRTWLARLNVAVSWISLCNNVVVFRSKTV
jgi:hypothetical protein